MIDAKHIEARAARLRGQFEAKLGVRSRTLSQALRRAGRRLPRGMRRQGALLVRAQTLAGNPHLARQIAPGQVDRAFAALGAHLEAIDVADRRRGRWLSLAGSVATNFLLVTGGFVVWLWWRGYV